MTWLGAALTWFALCPIMACDNAGSRGTVAGQEFVLLVVGTLVFILGLWLTEDA